MLTVSKQIKMLCVALGISQAELAKKLGTSPQNFSQKLQREVLTPKDLKAIAEVTGCTYETYFVLPDGEKIEY